MYEENRASYYAIIPAIVRYDDRLKPAEKILYGELTALSNKNGYCHAKNRYFASLYNVTNETISRWISHLEKLGYIYTEIKRNQQKKVIARYIYIKDLNYINDGQEYRDENFFVPLCKKIHTLLRK